METGKAAIYQHSEHFRETVDKVKLLLFSLEVAKWEHSSQWQCPFKGVNLELQHRRVRENRNTGLLYGKLECWQLTCQLPT